MLLSATKSRKKQQTELVQSVIHAEEEKRKKERENFHITSAPLLAQAATEPSLFHVTSEEHDETGKNICTQALSICLMCGRPESTYHIKQSGGFCYFEKIRIRVIQSSSQTFPL